MTRTSRSTAETAVSNGFKESKYATPTVVNLTRKQIADMYAMTQSFENIDEFEVHISTEATTLRFSMNLDQTTKTEVDTKINR
jgi:hypothetical protein